MLTVCPSPKKTKHAPANQSANIYHEVYCANNMQTKNLKNKIIVLYLKLSIKLKNHLEKIMEENETNQANETKDTNETNKTNDTNQKESFKTKFFDFLDKSVNVSKKGLKTASQKISDFGDKSVQKIELSQQKSKLESLYKTFGKECYTYLSASKDASLTSQTEQIKTLYNQVNELLKDISVREKNLLKKKNLKHKKTKLQKVK